MAVYSMLVVGQDFRGWYEAPGHIEPDGLHGSQLVHKAPKDGGTQKEDQHLQQIGATQVEYSTHMDLYTYAQWPDLQRPVNVLYTPSKQHNLSRLALIWILT